MCVYVYVHVSVFALICRCLIIFFFFRYKLHVCENRKKLCTSKQSVCFFFVCFFFKTKINLLCSIFPSLSTHRYFRFTLKYIY